MADSKQSEVVDLKNKCKDQEFKIENLQQDKNKDSSSENKALEAQVKNLNYLLEDIRKKHNSLTIDEKEKADRIQKEWDILTNKMQGLNEKINEVNQKEKEMENNYKGLLSTIKIQERQLDEKRKNIDLREENLYKLELK